MELDSHLGITQMWLLQKAKASIENGMRAFVSKWMTEV